MPTVASLEALERAAAAFEVAGIRLVIEPTALAAARRSLDSSGLLLLGRVRGILRNRSRRDAEPGRVPGRV